MKSFTSLAALAALSVLSAAPAGAQALVHRYSFNGSANDSVGGANGTIIGNVSLPTAPGVNGSAIFAGDHSSTNPGFISLPTSAVSSLQNATVEIFTSNFNMPRNESSYQALFAVANSYGNRTNYIVLSPNRGGAGVGVGARTNNGGETVVTSHDPLPPNMGNHVVDLVFSGFTGLGSTGTETIYLDGQQVAQGQTVFSFANVAAGPGGIQEVGIGGGSPYDDPTFSGSMSEVRLFVGALSAPQVAADVDAGPDHPGFVTTPVLQLSNTGASGVTDTSATLAWNTNNAADTVVLYGPTASYGSTANGATNISAHSLSLTGLAPRTLYHYQVKSTDSIGQVVTSPDATFTTSGPQATDGLSATVGHRSSAGVDIALTATDADNAALTYAVITNPAHGTLTLTGSTAHYTPNGDNVTQDAFTWKASHGTVDSSPATVTVTLSNTLPAAQNQAGSVALNGSLPVTLSSTDADNDPLTYAIVTGPTHGVLSGTAPSLTYAPASGYVGTDSFTFTANDGLGISNTATVSLSVTNPSAAVATDVTGQVKLSLSGAVYNRSSRRYVQTVTVTNTSGLSLFGPLFLALDNLPGGIGLVSPAGTTALTTPIGSTCALLQSGIIAPGGSMTTTLQFNDPSGARIMYKPRVLAGPAGTL